MIDNIAVGKTIAKLRQNRNMTQQQLAAALNVSHQAVSKWETGAALPDVQTLVALTRLFGITIEQLLDGDVPEDRVEAPKSASPFDEPIQNIGTFVNNLVDSIFRPEKKTVEEEEPASGSGDPEEEIDAAKAADETGAPEAEADPAQEPFDVQKLLQMAPYMSKAAVDELLLENSARLSAGDIARFAPFASQECLEQLIRNNEEEMEWGELKKVAPFLRREVVDNLARAAARGKRYVKDTIDQSGIDGDELGKSVQEVSQKIGSGVEKVFRKAGKMGTEMMEGVATAIGDFVDGVNKRQARAADLRKAACERALQDERWDWLADHVQDIDDEELLRKIAQKANGLGMHDWVLEHLNGYADTRTIDAAIEAGNWGWLGDHVWQFEDDLQEKIALAAAKQENWQWLSTYAEQISLEHCADEIGIMAYKAEARVLAGQIARHCMDPKQREKLADVVVANEDMEFLKQIEDILEGKYIGGMLVKAAADGNWDRVKMFVAGADADSVAALMQTAIDQGNFEAIDLLDEYL